MSSGNTHSAERCDLCGSAQADAILHIDSRRGMTSDCRVIPRELKKLRCRVCGLVRDGLPLSSDELLAYYTDAYTLNVDADEEHVYFTPDGPLPRSHMICEWILKLSPPESWHPGQRVLEVGCGQGNLLCELAGWFPRITFHGVELSARAAEKARVRGLHVTTGNVAQAPPGSYDRVIAFGVLEHVPSPTAFLQALRERLVPGGELIIGQPTQDVPSYDLFFVDHLYHFASGHIDAFARKVGFELIAADVGHPLDEDMSLHVLRRREGVAAAGEITAPIASGSIEAVESFLARFRRADELLQGLPASQRLAVFGVGEVFTLLYTYTSLSEREIVCGLDDNVERQRSSRWPFPVIAPQRANELAIDRVLICVNPVYTDAVERRLETLALPHIRLF